MKTVVLLILSNTFMTLAWYGHLKFRDKPLWLVILASWGIAFFEYLLQVPANRTGSYQFTVTQLKVMQECITLGVFTVVAWFLFGTVPRWNTMVAFAFIVGAVFFTFHFSKVSAP
ncbi:MAG TPA: DMT family protein [Verrucomicrobiae bacterium]|nr:DMT family protein [Verrucomicrobiae bacterium]